MSFGSRVSIYSFKFFKNLLPFTCKHGRFGKKEEGSYSLTDVEDSLFGRVLPRVPVLPVFKLLVSVLIFTEHHHDHALRGHTRQDKSTDESKRPNDGQISDQGRLIINIVPGFVSYIILSVPVY